MPLPDKIFLDVPRQKWPASLSVTYGLQSHGKAQRQWKLQSHSRIRIRCLGRMCCRQCIVSYWNTDSSPDYWVSSAVLGHFPDFIAFNIHPTLQNEYYNFLFFRRGNWGSVGSFKNHKNDPIACVIYIWLVKNHLLEEKLHKSLVKKEKDYWVLDGMLDALQFFNLGSLIL